MPGQAIVGTVTHPSRDRGSPEYERAYEPAPDTPVRGEEAERLALPEGRSQGGGAAAGCTAVLETAAHPEVKRTGAIAMDCSRQRPSRSGSPCQRSAGGPLIENGTLAKFEHAWTFNRSS